MNEVRASGFVQTAEAAYLHCSCTVPATPTPASTTRVLPSHLSHLSRSFLLVIYTIQLSQTPPCLAPAICKSTFSIFQLVVRQLPISSPVRPPARLLTLLIGSRAVNRSTYRHLGQSTVFVSSFACFLVSYTHNYHQSNPKRSSSTRRHR